MQDDGDVGRGRRSFLRLGAAAGATALAGCSDVPFLGGGSKQNDGEVTLEDFRGSGATVGSRGELTATRIEELPDLSGTLQVYLGGGESGLYIGLLDLFRKIYPEFDPQVNRAPSAQLANTIIEEKQGGGRSPADVFWSVDAGSLGAVASAGYTSKLPSNVVEPVPKQFHPDDQWVGTAGRARSIPYNTDRFSASDIPDDVSAFPSLDRFQDAMGWAPTYGSFQSFVTAMRVLEGPEPTKRWLRRMNDRTTEYRNEFFVSNAVASGEVGAGFANHYYALRVKTARPNAPIDLAFTTDDAGALVNTAGAAVVKGTKRTELARKFIRHLLSAEAQEYFATRTFAYPMVPGVPPVGGLPTIDELNPPNLKLTKLSELQPTLDLMREAGVL